MTTTEAPQAALAATPTTSAPTSATKASPPRRKLSELLAGLPENELLVVVDTYEEHVLKGTIRALPLAGERFTLSFLGRDARTIKKTLDDEIMEETGAFRTWLAGARDASRLALLHVTGRVETSVERLDSGADNFEKLLEVRRHRMRQKTGKSEASTSPRPAKKSGKKAQGDPA